jgi:hypothetical protein
MRYMVSIAFVGMCAFLALAQQPSQPPQDQSFEAKMRQEMMSLEQREARLKIEERKLDIVRREHELDAQRKMIDEPFACTMGEKNDARMPFLKSIKFPGHLLPLLIVAKLFFVALFFCCLCCSLLHILLTVLVFSDMQKRGSVNGLWIPVVLIGGLFAAMVYALMRNNAAKGA